MAKHVGLYMPPDLIESMKHGTMIGVLATFSDQAWPHTLPVQCFYPVDKESFLLSVHKRHTSYINMVWNKRVMCCFMDGKNIAYGVQGRAGVVKAPSSVHPEMHIFRIDVNDVKSDKSFLVSITGGVQWKFTSLEAQEVFQEMHNELKDLSKLLYGKK